MDQASHREQLTNLFAFVRLVLALEPGEWGYKDQRTERLVADVARLLEAASDEELARRSASAEKMLKGFCLASYSRIPPVYCAEQIGREFRELESQSDVSRFGVEYRWLAQRFKTPRSCSRSICHLTREWASGFSQAG